MGNLRNKVLAGLLALALFGPLGPSPSPTPVYAAGVSGVGFAEETLIVSSSALSITSTLCVVRGRQTPALLEVLSNAIYFTLNSPTATPDSGDYAAPVGTVISVERANYIRMIRQSVDSSVKVTCFREGELPTLNSYDKAGAGVTGSGATLLDFQQTDDTDVHAVGDEVAAMGAAATPTDTVVDANDYGALAMSLDRRLHTDSNIQVANGDVPGNTGVLTANVPRVTLATDDELNDDADAIRVAVEIIDNIVSGSEAQVDVLSQIPGTGATNLGKAMGTAVGATDTGVAALVRFTDNDTPVFPPGADTGWTHLQVDENGRLFVINLNDGGNLAAITGPISPGTGAANLGKADDVAHVAADVGVMALGVANNTVAALTDTNADYTPRGLTSTGAGLSVTINDANVSGARDTSKAEDDFIGNNAEALVAIAVLVDDALAAGAATSGDGSATLLRVDNFGSNWSALSADNGARIPADATAGLKVDLGADNDVTVTSGSITANAGTDLNTSALLTTAAHDAALGTAGAADSQVRSIQGIASGTPVEVNLAANNDVTVSQTNAITEVSIIELIGINEVVTASQYSASVALTLAGTGTIKKVCLIATEDGSGVVFTPAGDLMVFNTDPAIASDDATITNAERLTLSSIMTFAAADWQSDANGASNCQDVTEVFADATLFASWHSATGQTQWNSAAGDDEQLEFKVIYRRDT